VQASASDEPVPAITQLSVVARHAATGDGGNSWGGHQPRIVRTALGVFTAYSVASSRGPLHRRWRLVQQTASGWRLIGSGESGREPPSLLAGRDSQLFVVAWPGGLARMWTVTPTAAGWQTHVAAVPGQWIRSDWPYGSAAISPGGDITVVESDQTGASVSTTRGDIRMATRVAATGAWTWSVTPTPYRYCYAWLSPGEGDSLRLVATRGVLWSRMGYRRPKGAFAYVYDAIGMWHEGHYGAPALTADPLIKRVRPTRRYRDIVASAAQPDVYRDSRGLLHVFYQFRGPSTKGVLVFRHAVLDGNKVLADVALPPGLTYAKIVEDADGNLYVIGTRNPAVLSVYRARSSIGTVLGPETTHSLGAQPVRYAGLTVADERSGTPRSDSVDLVYPSGSIARQPRWVYLHLRLR
jgi:hypothetical protein